MEEEIPTALYLLRMIPRSSLEGQLGLSYCMFLISAMFRLAIGYMFLFNVLLVVVQSDRVLGKLDVLEVGISCLKSAHASHKLRYLLNLVLPDMFYDMLALNFVSMLDDISFRLAQLDILGKRLRNATTTACFRTEFERKPYAFRKKMTNLTKFIFVFNFLALIACVTTIGIYQQSGSYQCHSLSVIFGDDIVSCSLLLVLPEFLAAFAGVPQFPLTSPLFIFSVAKCLYCIKWRA